MASTTSRRFSRTTCASCASSLDALRGETMKLLYNWLKDFVDVTAPAKELASRLALSGTNIAGVEEGSHGAVLAPEESPNRPDCPGHYGLACEIAAVSG